MSYPTGSRQLDCGCVVGRDGDVIARCSDHDRARRSARARDGLTRANHRERCGYAEVPIGDPND
jgi:hypothetical protein